MFCHCKSLYELNISIMNNNNFLINAEQMFNDCSSLEEIDLSNLDFKYIKNMEFMFFACRSLKDINLNNFIFNDKIKISSMLINCSKSFQKYFKEKYKI